MHVAMINQVVCRNFDSICSTAGLKYFIGLWLCYVSLAASLLRAFGDDACQ